MHLIRRVRAVVRRRARDERGAFTLTELLLVGSLSLIVLAISASTLATMTDLSTTTRNKIDAEVRARQSMDAAMRYLRNAVPLSQCQRWLPDMPAGTDKTVANNMKYCESYTQTQSAISVANATDLVFYAYSGDDKTSPGIAPEKFQLSISGTTLSIKRYSLVQPNPSLSPSSMWAAACSAITTSGCPATKPTVWSTTPTTIASFEVASGSGFTYLNGSGATVTPSATGTTTSPIRTVLVDLTMAFVSKRPTNGSTTKYFAYHASASLRGALYEDDRQGA